MTDIVIDNLLNLYFLISKLGDGKMSAPIAFLEKAGYHLIKMLISGG